MRSGSGSVGVNPTGLLPLIAVYAAFAAHDILHTTPGEGHLPSLWVAAVLFVTTLTAGILLPGRVLSARASVAVIVGLAGGYLLAVTSWTDGVPSGGDDWPSVSLPIGLMLLALRGRTWTVPALFALDSVVMVVRDPAMATGSILAQLPILCASTFVALYVRPQVESVIALREARLAAARAEAAAAASVLSRNARLDWIDAVAGPTLASLTAPRPLDDDDRTTCRLLEAGIRDTLRAPGLTGAPLDEAVREVRGRGVDVTLLDDGGVPDPQEAARLRELLAEVVAGWDGPRVVVRIAPPGRPHVATVLLTGRDGRVVRRAVSSAELTAAGSDGGGT